MVQVANFSSAMVFFSVGGSRKNRWTHDAAFSQKPPPGTHQPRGRRLDSLWLNIGPSLGR